ncbi:restriction endonuclease PLD domain-containing protein [Leptospira levettii]|uniref:restriction endonuclease PLD domain-containing protein n=1 Tax=Leptospira levettii TaxID=2023178 RepID=UPI000C2A121A|nr:restriction endonuclease PLD domain-containing protein [Leptospira levettii]PKA22722.1 hypothetical protein CH381_29485 [Leptospira sp. mixed culture ATI2-C-A1]TGM23494.1 NgoFVII family restriction endonuclease [Leptospira levettii]
MFTKLQPKENIQKYIDGLQLIGSLSRLSSESSIPYLYYRIAERLFCSSFKAKDFSRSDISIDAKKDNIGIGLKTFLAGNNKSFQKIAEFNKEQSNYNPLKLKDKIIQISELRNKRIEFTKRATEIENSIYHCVVREQNKFKIIEEKLDSINIDRIKNIKENSGSIKFDDGINEYSFLISKSTLTKKFQTSSYLFEIEIDILEDPLRDLHNFFKTKLFEKSLIKTETIYLPLYGRDKHVFEKSGLNQWNADGRKRDPNEVYIPIPIKIHKYFPNFFPPRDQQFNLKLPNDKNLLSKVCQDGSKALMSYSNRDLGQWILRDVLKLEEGKILTYKMLEELGIDSVRIDKYGNNDYEINFAKSGSYEEFITDLENNNT